MGLVLRLEAPRTVRVARSVSDGIASHRAAPRGASGIALRVQGRGTLTANDGGRGGHRRHDAPRGSVIAPTTEPPRLECLPAFPHPIHLPRARRGPPR